MPNDFENNGGEVGGYGSGRWHRWSKKDTVEGYLRLDVRHLHRKGYMRPGGRTILTWHSGEGKAGSIMLLAYADRVELDYRQRVNGGEWHDVTQRVALTWTPCHYGGRRVWFVCPGYQCGRRVAVLYDAGSYFLCRHCGGLAYESQTEPPHSRMLSKAQAICVRLGGEAGGLEFPDKPARMHWRTYNRWLEKWIAAEKGSMAALSAWLGKMSADVDGLAKRSKAGR